MEKESNLIPFQSFRYQLKDQTEIQGWKLIPPESRAIILLIHGMGEHSQRYLHWANRFYQQGIAWYGFDLPGHGLSSGLKGHFTSLDYLFEAVNRQIEIVREAVGSQPLILYGHSMGGNLALQYLLHETHAFQFAIVTSPWIQLVHPPAAPMVYLAKMMNHLYPAFIQSSGLKSADMSSQPRESDRYEKDPLNHKKISARAFWLVHNGGIHIENEIQRIQIPVFLTHSSDDPLTLYGATERLGMKNKNIVFHEFSGVRHELHNDIKRDELFELEINFINKQLKNGIPDPA